MLDTDTIRSMSREAAAKAARRRLTPYYFWPGPDLQEQCHSIPYIGTYLPKGWSRVYLNREIDADPRGIYEGDNSGHGAYFVDSSGFGQDGEAAITAEAFMKRIRFDLAYAIVEAGEFQVKIGCFRRLKSSDLQDQPKEAA